ncbi:hypothetical protein BB561_006093 [Smittium simulii]|uniref:Reverse transcriptase domain-containing protein n=1 Tax=Smittium simulii TaxID=133385 RepID=A0A2T9Y6L4_9FUNG|nr:hypothetical protein BB561_006093 [Smittium simulii]
MNWINRMGVGLIRTPIYNSKGSRLKGSKMGRMIDHICSNNLGFQSISASVIKNADISDYFFVMAVWHVPNILKADETIIKIDRAKIQINSDKIINNNYYSVLNNSIENYLEDLNTKECIEKLLGTSKLNDLGVSNTPAMPKTLLIINIAWSIEPGLDDNISGLLFADNAVILAESADELQKLFITLTEWCKRWDMNVNNKKCGIMAINCPTVNKYKYLGIEFNDQWNNKAFFKAKKIKAFKGYMRCYSILKRNDIPSKFKIMFATYGGKLLRMSATRCKPIQQVVDAATQTLAKCGKSAAMARLRQELSLTDLNIKTAIARTRAFGKWSGLRT